jgi:hypothetical protein
MLRSGPGRSVSESSAPVPDAFLENVTVECSVIVDPQIEMLQNAVQVGTIHERDESLHEADSTRQ